MPTGIRKNHEQFLEEFNTIINNKGYLKEQIKIIGKYTKGHEPIECECLVHKGFIWFPVGLSILKGQGCPKCYGNKKKSTEEYAKEILNKKILPLEPYINNYTRIKHRCLVCNYEFLDNARSTLGKKWQCRKCHPVHMKAVRGVNTIFDTNPDLAFLLLDPEDGYKYLSNSHKKVDWKCGCGNIIKNKSIDKVNRQGLSCSLCNDNISRPNKIMSNLLKILKINFETEKIFDWCRYNYNNRTKTGRYDFYFKLNNNEYIVEMDGIQHYTEQNFYKNRLKEIQYSDIIKNDLAINRGIKVIRIDCSTVSFDFIKQNILQSELKNIISFEKVDWKQICKNSLSSLVLIACQKWNEGEKDINKIALELSLHSATVRKYLKKGAKINICDYKPYCYINKEKKK